MIPLLPEAAAEHAPWLRLVLVGVLSFVALIWLFLTAVFLAALIRFRRASSSIRKPPSKRVPLLFETIVFGVELALLMIVALPFWRVYADSGSKSTAPPLEIRIVAQQFVWNMHYPGPDGRFGRQRLELINESTNPLGLDREDPSALDDIVLRDRLHLESGRDTLLRLSSKDVVHGFSIPPFYVKRDMLPGLETQLHFTPTLTTDAYRQSVGDPERDIEIACAQLCGQGHYQMRGIVTVHSVGELDGWLAGQSPALGGEDDFFFVN
ncbi:MAG: Alternative cytochrome c oxidase subunit 2 [Candidatus Hydrogenedentota bacterium]|jgi:cytochrome c oxidase subunit 2